MDFLKRSFLFSTSFYYAIFISTTSLSSYVIRIAYFALFEFSILAVHLNHAVKAILHFFVEVTWLFKINLYFHEAFNQLLASSSRKCEMTRLSSRFKRTQASRSSSLSKERYFSKVLKWEVNCALADRCNCDEKWILARKKSKHILSCHFTSQHTSLKGDP